MVPSDRMTLEFSIWLRDNGFFTAPASTKWHGARDGGLFYHSLKVMENLSYFTSKFPLHWEREDSPYIVGMFHDLCKIDQYRGTNGNYDWNPAQMDKGHGDKSVLLLAAHMKLTEEEIACIRFHMGAFTDKEEWGCYTQAVSKYPNVLWTHTADMLASHVHGV